MIYSDNIAKHVNNILENHIDQLTSEIMTEIFYKFPKLRRADISSFTFTFTNCRLARNDVTNFLTMLLKLNIDDERLDLIHDLFIPPNPTQQHLHLLEKLNYNWFTDNNFYGFVCNYTEKYNDDPEIVSHFLNLLKLFSDKNIILDLNKIMKWYYCYGPLFCEFVNL